MKKKVAYILPVCFALTLLNGCSKKEAPQNAGADIDLTVLSSTVAYAEIFSIYEDPDAYIGKTIKMRGAYYSEYYGKTDQYYHYVYIEEAAACCMQGIEFIWKGKHAWPDDYPEERETIEVTGVFSSYKELGETWFYLDVEDINV
jgi:hypothetical protein